MLTNHDTGDTYIVKGPRKQVKVRRYSRGWDITIGVGLLGHKQNQAAVVFEDLELVEELIDGLQQALRNARAARIDHEN